MGHEYLARFRLHEGGCWSQERDLVAWHVAGGRRRRPCYALHQALQVNNIPLYETNLPL